MRPSTVGSDSVQENLNKYFDYFVSLQRKIKRIHIALYHAINITIPYDYLCLFSGPVELQIRRDINIVRHVQRVIQRHGLCNE